METRQAPKCLPQISCSGHGPDIRLQTFRQGADIALLADPLGVLQLGLGQAVGALHQPQDGACHRLAGVEHSPLGVGASALGGGLPAMAGVPTTQLPMCVWTVGQFQLTSAVSVEPPWATGGARSSTLSAYMGLAFSSLVRVMVACRACSKQVVAAVVAGILTADGLLLRAKALLTHAGQAVILRQDAHAGRACAVRSGKRSGDACHISGNGKAAFLQLFRQDADRFVLSVGKLSVVPYGIGNGTDLLRRPVDGIQIFFRKA